MKRSFFQAAVASILLYWCTTWTLTKRLEKKLDGNYTKMLRVILNKSWRQHPTRHQLYGHLPPASCFYGILTLVGYSMPNLVYIYIYICVLFNNVKSKLFIYKLYIYIYIYIYMYIKVKLATVVEDEPKAPFSIATTPRCWGGRYSFPWIAPLYLMLLSIMQGGIKYHY